MEPLIKRKSGAQPGNQNARKHGFYSKMLTPQEKRSLRVAADLDGLDQEIAVMRVKLQSLIAQDSNQHLVNQTAETLARLYHIKFSLSRSDTSRIKDAVNAALADFIIPRPPDSPPAP
jgi:hypothetical protein